jgi:hypothetical protein
VEFPPGADLAGTPFAKHRKFEVNTHCGDSGLDERTHFGRVANQVSPVCEELVYRLIRAAGVATYRTRLANVRWFDTSTVKEDGIAQAVQGAVAEEGAEDGGFARNALLVESPQDTIANFESLHLLPASSVVLPVPSSAMLVLAVDMAPMDGERIKAIHLAEALVGNYDWAPRAGGGIGRAGALEHRPLRDERRGSRVRVADPPGLRPREHRHRVVLRRRRGCRPHERGARCVRRRTGGPRIGRAGDDRTPIAGRAGARGVHGDHATALGVAQAQVERFFAELPGLVWPVVVEPPVGGAPAFPQ